MDFTNKDECARGRGKRDDGRDWRSWNGLSEKRAEAAELEIQRLKRELEKRANVTEN